MSGGGITISYDYYLYLTNTDGTDMLLVEISSNGDSGPWTEIARHDTDGELSWRSHTIDQNDLDTAGVTLTANMKIRFTANDGNTQSIVESGLDAFQITGFTCAAQEYTLTVSTVGSGSVTKDPDQATYTYGQNVELTANADPGWSFDHWEGDLTGSDNPDTIVMDDDKTVTAVFAQDQYTLTINISGSGSVTKDPDQATYTYGQTVDLEAIADPGWVFDHWSGDLGGSTNPDQITITDDMSVTAHFTQIQYTLTVNTVGNGSVTKDPDQATYTYGQTVDLTADGDPGWSFDHWSGDLGGSTNPDQITITDDMSVTAHFVEDSCPNPGGSGNYCAADVYPNNGDDVWDFADDGDCVVNASDLGQLLSNYGITSGMTREDGDVYPPGGGDGGVDASDLGELLAQYGDDCN
jgi:uncharacterized repeat protein (TIGR02543 family)